MHGHTGGHIGGGGHLPPPSHQPHHPGHHSPGQPVAGRPPTYSNGLLRSPRNPRVMGAVAVVAFALVILLLVVFV
jgi:hypothetical protein